jgi:putative membrane protein
MSRRKGGIGVFILRILLSAVAVVVASLLLPGVEVTGWWYAVLVALVLSVLNAFIKPILIFLTLPATVVTFGLFLLVINTVIILLADTIVSGFTVSSFWWALLFSLIMSLINSFFASQAGLQTENKY